jgi:hypothetical protein
MEIVLRSNTSYSVKIIFCEGGFYSRFGGEHPLSRKGQENNGVLSTVSANVRYWGLRAQQTPLGQKTKPGEGNGVRPHEAD